MIDTSTKYYWEFMKKNKIIEDVGDGKRYKIHPLLGAILGSNLGKNILIIDAISNTAKSYLPESSSLERALVCQFLAKKLTNSMPEQARQLDIETKFLDLVGAFNGKSVNPLHLKNFDDVINRIRNTSDLK